MRVVFALVLLCLYALPASAQSLRGHWQMEWPINKSYVGVVLIDAEGRVTFDSPNDGGRPEKFRGYVARGEADGIKIVITNGSQVIFGYCAHETADKLHCYFSREAGKSSTCLLTRVGPGPLTLAPQ